MNNVLEELQFDIEVLLGPPSHLLTCQHSVIYSVDATLCPVTVAGEDGYGKMEEEHTHEEIKHMCSRVSFSLFEKYLQYTWK